MSRHLSRSLRLLLAATTGVLFVVSCREQITAPVAPVQRVADISDALHGDTGRLYFIAPLVREPAARRTGLFDPSRRPAVTICRWVDDACDGPESRFETDTAGDVGNAVAVHLDAAHGWYSLIWKTPIAVTDAAVRFRIRVSDDSLSLGFADVRVVDSLPVGTLLHDTLTTGDDVGDDVVIDTAGTVSIQGRRRLPIRFRLIQPSERLVVATIGGFAEGLTDRNVLVPRAAVIPYRYVAAAGYENPNVRLDGRPVPSEGVIVADTPHWLSVTASRRAVVPDDATDLYQLARSTLTAADPVAQYQAYLDATGLLRSRVDSTTAAETLGAIEYLAFHQLSDAPALFRLDSALSGHLFTLPPSPEPTNGQKATKWGTF